jgi:hypothetical protein
VKRRHVKESEQIAKFFRLQRTQRCLMMTGSDNRDYEPLRDAFLLSKLDSLIMNLPLMSHLPTLLPFCATSACAPTHRWEIVAGTQTAMFEIGHS